MIGTIRRHQQWLWFIIIAAIIISFVWYFQPSRRMAGGGGGSDEPTADLGSVFGQPVTPQEYAAAKREGRLVYRIRFNEWPTGDQDQQIDRLAAQRLVLDAELKAHKITVTDQAAARYAKQLLGVRPEDAMPQDRLNQFVQNDLMTRGQLSFEDFNNYVRHQAGQEYLISLYGMSGKLITSNEAEFFYRRENEPMAVEMVSFPASEFYAQTEPSEQEVKEYFDKHEADYRIPDQVQVNYIAFDASNYLARADKQLGTNIDDRIDELYHQQGADVYKDDAGKPLSQAAAEAKIKTELRAHTALMVAQTNAEAFVTELAQGHDDDHPYTAADLSTLAQSKGLNVSTSQPFDEKDGTPEIDVPPVRLQVLFQLRSDDPDDKERSMLYAASPLVGTNAVYVAGLEKRLPSRLRTLTEVRDRVIKDYRQEKALALAKAAGDRFAAAVQTGLAEGKTFDAVCSSQAVKAKLLAPFALTTQSIAEIPDKTEFEQLQQAVFNLPAGQASKLLPTTDGGMVVYVRNRLPVDDTAMQKQMPEYLEKMRQQRQIAAFEEWFGREMQLHYVPPPDQRSNPVG